MYFFQRLILNPESVRMGQYTIDDLLWFMKMVYAYIVLSWTAIFAVKLSFLSFFRTLIERVSGRLITYWKIALVFTIVSGAFNICEVFITCPHFDYSAAGMWQSKIYTHIIRTNPSMCSRLWIDRQQHKATIEASRCEQST